jgi:Cysteine-rich CWC/Family of unknown function (DUF5522)
MLLRLRQRAGVNSEHFIVPGQREHDLQPSPSVASANRPILPVLRLPVSPGSNHSLTFRDADAVFGGMVQVPLNPPERVALHRRELYTLNPGIQRDSARTIAESLQPMRGPPRSRDAVGLRCRGMPISRLRFCRGCLAVRQTATREVCGGCGGELLPLLDGNGAISREFLVARGSCCDSGCRNCPYEKGEPVNGQCDGGGREKSCPRCGAGFQCCGGACWCENVRLSAAALAQLERGYDGCLCPACLAEFSAV